MNRLSCVAILCCLAALASCKKHRPLTPAEMNALVDAALAEEAETVKRLDALDTLPGLMEKIPPTVSAEPFGVLKGKARFGIPGSQGTPMNVLLVHVEDLQARRQVRQPYLSNKLEWIMNKSLLAKIRAAKAAGQPYGHLYPRELRDFQEAAYVVVVRGTYTAPVVTSKTTFTGGGFVGDAQVFQLGERPAHLGGVPVAVTNSANLSFRDAGGTQGKDAVQALGEDLSTILEVHLCRQLMRYAGMEIPASHMEKK